MQNNEKKLLLQISNLKQYFPVGKGRYVRANDGITLDIYEGETFGLVGESGCGKSTLGRSILQLYKQTDGRTMYFGRSIDELAPKYAHDTFATLTKRRADMKAKQEKYAAFRAEYDKMEEVRRYAAHEEMVRLRKEANDARLDVTTLIGGLFAYPDLGKVESVFKEQYKISKELSNALDKQASLELDLADISYQLDKAKEAGKPNEKLTAKTTAAQRLMRSTSRLKIFAPGWRRVLKRSLSCVRNAGNSLTMPSSKRTTARVLTLPVCATMRSVSSAAICS